MFFLLLQVTEYTSNAMSNSVKPLKYREEMTKRGVTIDCPISVSPSKKISAFRFVYSPKEHELNFIPNVLIDEMKNVPFNYSNDEYQKQLQLCKRCAISLFDTLENIQNRWDNATQKFKKNYGYTHIAEGEIHEGDGLMGDISNTGHFSFYEFEDSNIHERFELKIAI